MCSDSDVVLNLCELAPLLLVLHGMGLQRFMIVLAGFPTQILCLHRKNKDESLQSISGHLYVLVSVCVCVCLLCFQLFHIDDNPSVLKYKN